MPNLTFAEVAAELRISRSTLSRLLKRPGVTYLKVGRAIQFRPADHQRLMESLEHTTPEMFISRRPRQTVSAVRVDLSKNQQSVRDAVMEKTRKPSKSKHPALDAEIEKRQKRLLARNKPG